MCFIHDADSTRLGTCVKSLSVGFVRSVKLLSALPNRQASLSPIPRVRKFCLQLARDVKFLYHRIMKIHFLKHTSLEGLGIIDEWVEENGHVLTGTHSYKHEQLPDPAAFDFLIVMGGPQSACDLARYSYLQEEIKLIQSAIEQDKHVLGICLGAQLISEALGAKAEKSPEKEIGCYPVQLTEAGKQDRIFKNFPEIFASLHWHYDMPGIPPGAELLAKSVGCPRQALRYSDRVYGLQFHLEFNKNKMAALIKKAMHNLEQSTYTQTSQEILSVNFDEINYRMKLILDELINY